MAELDLAARLEVPMDAPTDEPKRKRKANVPGAEGKPSADRAPRAPRRAPGAAVLERKLTDLGVSIATLVAIFGDPVCGPAIADGAPRLAEAVCRVADGNAKVRGSLDRITSAGEWGDVFAASMAIALPVLAHHGLLPVGLLARAEPAPGPAEPEADAIAEAEAWVNAGNDDGTRNPVE